MRLIRLKKQYEPKILIVDDQIFNVNALRAVLVFKFQIPSEQIS